MAHTLYKIEIDELPHFVFSNLPAELGDVKIRISDGNRSYTGEATKNELEKMAAEAEMDPVIFYDLLRQSVSGCNTDNVRFIYQFISSEDDSYKFVWKQLVDTGIMVQLGTILFKCDDNPGKTTMEIFTNLTSQLKDLKAEVLQLTSVAEISKKSKEEMTKKLERYVASKESLEKDLYTKFALVLNEKKAKLRRLKAIYDAGPQVVPRGVTHEDSETDELTDNDNRSSNHEDADLKQIEKATEFEDLTESNAGTDIVLDDAVSDDEVKPRRNHKRLKASKPTTPLMPRTSSFPRPQQLAQEERESARRKRKSRDVLEELLDDL